MKQLSKKEQLNVYKKMKYTWCPKCDSESNKTNSNSFKCSFCNHQFNITEVIEKSAWIYYDHKTQDQDFWFPKGIKIDPLKTRLPGNVGTKK